MISPTFWNALWTVVAEVEAISTLLCSSKSPPVLPLPPPPPPLVPRYAKNPKNHRYRLRQVMRNESLIRSP